MLAPDYRDSTGFDYRVNATSALIDAGTSSMFGTYTPPGFDGDGAVRINPNDIGAFEYSPCGDGIVDAGVGEQCDDKNRRAGDGCDAACQIEPNYIFQGPLFATDVDCDCIYTIDNTGLMTFVKSLPPAATAPASMAVNLNRSLLVADNTTGDLYSISPKKKKRMCSGLPVLGGLAVSPVPLPGPGGIIFPAGTLFGSDAQLFAINQKNCNTLTLGTIIPNGGNVAGLDFRPDGTLFGAKISAFGSPEDLFTIDTVTGQGTAVGTIGLNFVLGSLVFDGNGVPWISDISNRRLLRIDPLNGSIIHEILLSATGPGLPSAPQGLGVVAP